MILYANSRVDTAVVGHVISAVSMMTTRAMIVNSDSCILKGYLVHHGSPRLSRPVPPGARSVPLNDVLCVGRMISTFACDVSINLRRAPPPVGVGILGLPRLEDYGT